MKQRSPSIKESRLSSAQQNQSVAMSVVEKSQQQQSQLAAFEKRKRYAEEQKNISKRQDQADPEKMKQGNIMLKQAIQALVQHLDQIIAENKERKKQERAEKYKKPQQPPDLRQQLGRQERQIAENHVVLKQLNKQLENSYNIHQIAEKEDKVKFLEKEHQRLLEERAANRKISELQNGVLEEAQADDIERDIAALVQDISQVNREVKETQEQINQKEKQIQKLHSQKVTKELALKELKQRIEEKKKKPDQEITDALLQQFEKEIAALKKALEQQGLTYAEKLRKLEAQRNATRGEVEKKVVLRDRLQKDVRLNNLYIKEVKRYNQIEEQAATAKSRPAQNGGTARKSTTPGRDSVSPKSQQSRGVNRPSSKRQVEEIREEQFEETMAMEQRKPSQKKVEFAEAKRGDQGLTEEGEKPAEEKREEARAEQQRSKPATPREQGVVEEEIVSESDSKVEQTQQANIYKKPLMMMKKK